MVAQGAVQARVEARRQEMLLEMGAAGTLDQLPERMRANMLFNIPHRDAGSPNRWCPACDRRYSVQLDDRFGRDREREEAYRSGICSEECFIRLTSVPLYRKDAENDHPDRERPDGPPVHDIKLYDESSSPAFEPTTFKCDSCATMLPATPQGCPNCHIAKYCGRECFAAAWPRHKHVCKLQAGKGGHSVMLAVRLNCRKEVQQPGRLALEQVRLARGDVSLFEGVDPAQGTCPVPALAGVPLVVRRLPAPEICQSKEDFDNVVAARLHIKPSRGFVFVPVLWALFLGPCVVYRADGRDLTMDDV